MTMSKLILNKEDLTLGLFKLKSLSVYHRSDPKRVQLEVTKQDGSVSVIELTSESDIQLVEHLNQ